MAQAQRLWLSRRPSAYGVGTQGPTRGRSDDGQDRQHKHVNPLFIVTMRIDHWYGATTLVIKMADGSEHVVEHDPGKIDGSDVYVIEKQILAAIDQSGGGNLDPT